jgi:membrane protease YdiL (CAAX protease family)
LRTAADAGGSATVPPGWSNIVRFDWRLREGIASPANSALLLAALLIFPLILQWTGALTIANMGSQSTGHTQAFLRFCIVLTVFLWTIFIIAFAGIQRRGAITWRQLIGAEWRGRFTVIVHLGVSVLVFAVMVLIGNISNIVLGPFQHDSNAFHAMVARTPAEALAFLVLALSAGFVEEFVFRGYVQRQCQALFGNTALASVAQIAIFTQGHVYQGWLRLIPVMLIALVVTLTALWRRSLIPGMIAHGLGDGLVSFLYFFKHL